jgi:hypothetical protein
MCRSFAWIKRRPLGPGVKASAGPFNHFAPLRALRKIESDGWLAQEHRETTHELQRRGSGKIVKRPIARRRESVRTEDLNQLLALPDRQRAE